MSLKKCYVELTKCVMLLPLSKIPYGFFELAREKLRIFLSRVSAGLFNARVT